MNQLVSLLSRKSDELRSTIDLSFCYARFTPEGVLEDCNENFSNLFGYESASQIIGLHHKTFVSTVYSETDAYKNFWSDLASGNVKTGEFQRQNKQGNTVFINAAYTPQKSKSGSVKCVIKIASDITPEKQNANQFVAIKQSIDLSYAFILFDTQGNILDANDIFVRCMGYSALKEIQGQHHSIFVRHLQKIKRVQRILAGFTKWQNQIRGIRKGVKRWESGLATICLFSHKRQQW